jgi:serine/threonine-protein kinase
MDENRAEKIEMLIEEALLLPEEERDAFLDRECGNDSTLRNEVSSLLGESDLALEYVQNLSQQITQLSFSELSGEIDEIQAESKPFFKHYRIDEKLGSGGMGVVYKAFDTHLDRTVALKFLTRQMTVDQESKERFLREAKAAAALNHPNICTVYAIEEDEERQFITMEYVEGTSLQKMIESESPDLENSIHLALQIADALAIAHDKGVIHRDIKPGNILVTDQRDVKVIDFGLAKLAGRTVVTQTGKTMGTVAYMSPEQIKGSGVDHRTDIWSFGVLLYELLTGEHPFRGEYDQAVLYSIVNCDPDPMPGVSSELGQIVMKALAKNSDHRYQQFDELVEDLRAVSSRSGSGSIRLPSFRKSAAKTVLRFSGAALLLIFTVILLIRFFPPNSGEIDSLVVLPFRNISGDPGQEYFADGMTEAITAELGQIGALKVISGTSALRYKNSDKTASEISRELNVDGLVEGSVLPAGDEVRITLQLIDGATDQHIWSESYTRNLRDILSLQNEIARTVVGQIQVSLSPEEQSRLATTETVDPEAYRHFLIGNHHLNNYFHQKALASYQQAIEIDNDYAEAHAAIAVVYMMMGSWWGTSPPQEVIPKSEAAIKRALELDPNTSEAYIALGAIKYLYEWDWEGADEAFRRGLELNPSSSFYRLWYSTFLMCIGRHEESIMEVREALDFDPLSANVYSELAAALHLNGQYEEAFEVHQEALSMDPNSMKAHDLITAYYLQTGDYEMARKHLDTASSLWGKPDGLHACYYGMIGDIEKAENMLAQLMEIRESDYLPAINISMVHIGLGNIEEALDWLEKGYEERNALMVWVREDPLYKPLYNEPRFQEIVHKMNFPENEL